MLVASGRGDDRLAHWDGRELRLVGTLRPGEGSTAAVVRRRELWLSTGDEQYDRDLGRTVYRSATLEGIRPEPVAVVPAIVTWLGTAPDGTVLAMSDHGAIWISGAARGTP